jgi:hypothetical protein
MIVDNLDKILGLVGLMVGIEVIAIAISPFQYYTFETL